MNYQVLLIDDERASYEFVQDILAASREDSFTVYWKVGYEDALEAMLSDTYDVCLLDYNMGVFTGFDLLKEVRKRGARIPIILLTGHGSRELDMDALNAGAAEYLDKTRLKPVLVSRTIRYAVRQQQDRNKLEDLYKQVSELEQLKTDMIRIAAHDLRNPLMTMLNYTQYLQTDEENPLQDYQQEYLSEVIGGVRRMQQIINDILSLERIQETDAARYEQQADMTEVIRLACLDAIPPDRKLSLELNLHEDSLIVQGDPSLLREAANNIVSNAVKYTPDGGHISVELKLNDGEVIFSVTDDGYGIPEAMQKRLFQPFYRAKSREIRHINGTGLGLHLVSNVVRRHKGEVFFKSVHGDGSTFGFRLPLLDNEEVEQTDKLAKPNEPKMAVEPAKTDEPTKPDAPKMAVEPEKNDGTTKADKPTKSDEPTTAVEPEKSDEPTEDDESKRDTKPTRPARLTQEVVESKVTKPTEDIDPKTYDELTEDTKPTKPINLSQEDDQSETDVPAKDDKAPEDNGQASGKSEQDE